MYVLLSFTETNRSIMTNNKQQTAVEWYDLNSKQLEFFVETKQITWEEYYKSKDKLIQQVKEKYEHEMCVFADEYASYVLEQSKPGIKGAMVAKCAWTFFKNRR
jgi:hypothetical protein